MTRWERLKYTFVRPDDEDIKEKDSGQELTVEEIQALQKRADDKERAIGLVAAPLAAAIAFMVITALIDRDRTPGVKVVTSVSEYHWLLLVLLALAVLMLVGAMVRKRLLLGLALALYAVSMLQLGWWGFAIPFAVAGGWYLVRSYRLSQDLKRATAENAPSPRPASRSGLARPRSNKRYTPPR